MLTCILALDKEAVDSRSVYVGNVSIESACCIEGSHRSVFNNTCFFVQVDYGTAPEELQNHFQSCGTINRVTIICDKFTGHPKG